MAKKDDSPPWVLVLPATVLSCVIAILASPSAVLGPDGRGVPRFQQLSAKLASSEQATSLAVEARDALQSSIAELSGNVLVLDAGVGSLVGAFSSSVSLSLAESRPFLLPTLRAAANSVPVHNMSVQNLTAISNASLDAVVASSALCRANLTLALPELKRALKSDAALIFAEPVMPLRPRWVRRLQTLASPLLELVTDGCRIDEDLAGLLAEDGWRVDAKQITLNGLSSLLGQTFLLGSARP